MKNNIRNLKKKRQEPKEHEERVTQLIWKNKGCLRDFFKEAMMEMPLDIVGRFSNRRGTEDTKMLYRQ